MRSRLPACGAAAEIFERLLKKRPGYLPARFWIGVWHEQNGDTSEAQKLYANLLQDPNMIEPLRGTEGVDGAGRVAERGLDAHEAAPRTRSS